LNAMPAGSLVVSLSCLRYTVSVTVVVYCPTRREVSQRHVVIRQQRDQAAPELDRRGIGRSVTPETETPMTAWDIETTDEPTFISFSE
jgi:hypothetical protein